MEMMLIIVAFLLAIFVLVLVHESGHFLAAKCLGVPVERFAIGFGWALCRWRSRKGTEYQIAPILLGGYVKLDDAAYAKAAVWRRMVIMLAGVTANMLFAILIYWAVFIVGVTVPKPIIGQVEPNSIAAVAGLKIGEQIQTVDGQAVTSWQTVALLVTKRLGDTGYMTINGHKLALASWRVNATAPDPISSLGLRPYQPTIAAVIARVEPDSPAAKIGLQVNDRVLAINKNRVTNWQQLLSFVAANPNQPITLTIKRGQKTIELSGVTGNRFGSGWQQVGFLGVGSKPIIWPKTKLSRIQYSLPLALVEAWHETWSFFSFNFIIVSKIITGKISLRVLGGPVTIFAATELAFRQGLMVYILFLAMLSVMLAFVNILPIPVLDGGNFIILLVEAVRRKAFSEKTQMIVNKVGMLFLALIIFVALSNDLWRLLT